MIDLESQPSVLGESLRRIESALETHGGRCDCPGFPQSSPYFPMWTRQRSAFEKCSTVSTLIFSHRAVWKLENDGLEGFRHPNCGGTEFTPHATQTKLETKSIYCTIVGHTWHSQADNRLSCELDDIESPYQPSNIILLKCRQRELCYHPCS